MCQMLIRTRTEGIVHSSVSHCAVCNKILLHFGVNKTVNCLKWSEKMGCVNTKGKTGKLQVEVDEVATPYAGKLEPLKIGDVITVQGLVHPECERCVHFVKIFLYLIYVHCLFFLDFQLICVALKKRRM